MFVTRLQQNVFQSFHIYLKSATKFPVKGVYLLEGLLILQEFNVYM